MEKRVPLRRKLGRAPLQATDKKHASTLQPRHSIHLRRNSYLDHHRDKVRLELIILDPVPNLCLRLLFLRSAPFDAFFFSSLLLALCYYTALRGPSSVRVKCLLVPLYLQGLGLSQDKCVEKLDAITPILYSDQDLIHFDRVTVSIEPGSYDFL